MAKQAKSPLTIIQLRHATAALDDLLEVRRRIDQFTAFVGSAEVITATLDRPGGQPLLFLLNPSTILEELEAEDIRLADVLRRLNVEVPELPPASSPPTASAEAPPRAEAAPVPTC